MRKLPEGSGKRCMIAFRTTEDVEARLKATAKASGRSLAQEIELRLSQSMRDEDVRLAIREELRAELRAELRSEIRLAMAEYTVEIGEDDGDEARH